MDLQSVQTFLATTASELAIKVLAAVAFWIVGRWLIGKVIGLIQAGMGRNNVDPTLTKYLGSIVAIALNIALVLGILGYFGIQTTSFAAMLAGAGVAIGAAWSGMLGNFAAGAFMLILRPFKVGDFVSIGGITGIEQGNVHAHSCRCGVYSRQVELRVRGRSICEDRHFAIARESHIARGTCDHGAQGESIVPVPGDGSVVCRR